MWIFYPRSPCGERPSSRTERQEQRVFYPRSPCGERLGPVSFFNTFFIFSIHALLAESDVLPGYKSFRNCIFLSTLSLRRATLVSMFDSPNGKNFLSTLSLRRATAPNHNPCSRSSFLSTLSLRRATLFFIVFDLFRNFSIHALLAESDPVGRDEEPFRGFFYPRSPCGERPIFGKINTRGCNFLSTLSLRRATTFQKRGCIIQHIFYPRSPCGERREREPALSQSSAFLSTLSLRRATPGTVSRNGAISFLSTLSLRRATVGRARWFYYVCFSIHALLAESDRPDG